MRYKRICDRCGNLFFEKAQKRIIRSNFSPVPIDVFGICIERYGESFKLDLCPECMDSFSKWYEQGGESHHPTEKGGEG